MALSAHSGRTSIQQRLRYVEVPGLRYGSNRLQEAQREFYSTVVLWYFRATRGGTESLGVVEKRMKTTPHPLNRNPT